MVEQISFSYASVVEIIVLIGSLIGFYYKMRLDIGKLYMKIAEIEKDREKRWNEYHETCDKNEAYMSELLKAINTLNVNVSDLKGDIKQVATHIEHLREKHLREGNGGRD